MRVAATVLNFISGPKRTRTDIPSRHRKTQISFYELPFLQKVPTLIRQIDPRNYLKCQGCLRWKTAARQEFDARYSVQFWSPWKKVNPKHVGIFRHTVMHWDSPLILNHAAPRHGSGYCVNPLVLVVLVVVLKHGRDSSLSWNSSEFVPHAPWITSCAVCRSGATEKSVIRVAIDNFLHTCCWTVSVSHNSLFLQQVLNQGVHKIF